MIHKIIKGLAPLAILASATLVSGCDGVNVQIGDTDGVPLAELDMSGPAPTELVLAGPDNVFVTEGEKLSIDVSGDEKAVDALRFSLDDGALGISREKDSWKNNGTAIVRVTLPSLTGITLAGSGDIEAETLSGKGDVTIAGSGKTKINRVDTSSLDLTIAGSGSFEAAGTTGTLDMTIAGSGKASMAGLSVETADISVAGSGDTEFASDGKVEANIVGSGSVTVIGRADCTVSSLGSGKLRCQNPPKTAAPAAKPEAGEAPEAPDAPDAPTAPDA